MSKGESKILLWGKLKRKVSNKVDLYTKLRKLSRLLLNAVKVLQDFGQVFHTHTHSYESFTRKQFDMYFCHPFVMCILTKE